MTAVSLKSLFPRSSDLVTQITGLTLDSREVITGDLFVALKGSELDGHDFVQDAIERGAAAIACERELRDLPVPSVSDSALRAKIGELAARFYGEPALALRIVAVTGTNGKTSVCWYVASLLAALDIPAACHGTIGWGTPPKLASANLTTPDAVTMQARLNALRFRGVRWVALEASSHALDQDRLGGVNPEVAVFTNLSRDHLDYHRDMDAYLVAKARLFSMPSVKTAVVNIDDAASSVIRKAVNKQARVVTVGRGSGADVRYALQERATGVELQAETPWGRYACVLPMIGETGPLNLLTAMTSLAAAGIDMHAMWTIATGLPPVPGRMQVFDAPVPIIVDYAHTPDALARAMKSLQRRFADGVVCVFGCGGERDQGKRALMAEVVDSLAVDAWVTDDNPRGEPPCHIRDEVCRRFSRLAPHNVGDRARASEEAYRSARPGQALLIAGKGHEFGIECGGCVIPHSDIELARNLSQNRQVHAC